MSGRIDLHSHSNFSDGTFSPQELIDEAIWNGLSAVALTDHDNLDGLTAFEAAGKEKGIETIRGVELSCVMEDAEVHILGLLVEPDTELSARLVQLRDEREVRMQKMLDKLAEMSINIPYEDVRVGSGKAVGRPHLAQALVAKGIVRDIGEAFEKLIGDHGPAYVEKHRLTVREGIRLIHQAHGLAILAHPMIGDLVGRIGELAAMGIDGVEQYYPKHDTATEQRIGDVCRRYELEASGGSDFHGNAHGPTLGSVEVPYSVLEKLKRRKANRWA